MTEQEKTEILDELEARFEKKYKVRICLNTLFRNLTLSIRHSLLCQLPKGRT